MKRISLLLLAVAGRALSAQPGFPRDNPDSWVTAGTAKILCSALFVSGREQAEARAHVTDSFIGKKVDSITMEEVVGGLLRERGLTLALAESCTGGLVGHRVTNVPGSSRWFRGAIVPYVNDAKTAMSQYSDLKGIYVHWSGPVPGILQAEKAAGKFTKVGAANHIILYSNDGTPQEHGWIRTGQEDATISQPATLYAQYAVYYAKQALLGASYHAGQKTTHGSRIVNLLGNLEDAIVAPQVTKANVNDPALWGNYKKK